MAGLDKGSQWITWRQIFSHRDRLVNVIDGRMIVMKEAWVTRLHKVIQGPVSGTPRVVGKHPYWFLYGYETMEADP